MNTYRYWRQAWRCRSEHSSPPTWRQLYGWLPAWQRSLRGDCDSMSDERPWLTFGAVEFLETQLASYERVFEWGSGGSSLYFARRAASVYSVEHDPAWYERVQTTIHGRHLTNWQGFLHVPERNDEAVKARADDWNGYVSNADSYRGCDFRSYASQIDCFADEFFDIVVIDGRARPSCVKHALAKVRIGGCLVWDNSEREYYAPAMRLVPPSFERHDFPGPGPYITGFWRTTIWVRRDNRMVAPLNQ